MLRGGSWNNKPNNLRSANRNRNDPGNRNNNNGLRLAQSAHNPGAAPFTEVAGAVWVSMSLFPAVAGCRGE